MIIVEEIEIREVMDRYFFKYPLDSSEEEETRTNKIVDFFHYMERLKMEEAYERNFKS